MAKQGQGEAGLVGGTSEALGSASDVPISEAVIEEGLEQLSDQENEEKIGMLEARVVELEGELASADEAVRMIERRGEIDRELVAARAIDLETARMLTEATIEGMESPDVAIAVRELSDRKPFLFAGKKRTGGFGVGGASMGAASVRSGDDELASMASDARSSGDRSELLRYLRVRRGR